MTTYARMMDGVSDVTIMNNGAEIKCLRCKLQQRRKSVNAEGDEVMIPVPPVIQVDFSSRAEALAHLDSHMGKGHLVPEGALDKIRAEITVYGYEVG